MDEVDELYLTQYRSITIELLKSMKRTSEQEIGWIDIILREKEGK